MEEKKFYQKGWFTILLLILFWPAGLIVMWVNNVFSKKVRIIITAIFAVLMLSSLIGNNKDNNSSSTVEATTVSVSDKNTEAQTETQIATKVTTEATTEPQTKAAVTEPQDTATMGMKNALASAKNYLSFSAFSYKGLIEQLKYEQYSDEEAVYAVENCGADWNEQAAKSAENYLSFSSFSRQELKDQLIYEGFTEQQAEYGVSAVGY